MKNPTSDNLDKVERHKILTKQLTEAQANHMRIYENYYSGNATAEQLIEAQEHLNKVHEEWRSTIVTLKKIQD